VELQGELFNPFRRGARDSRTAKTAGLGLGLYISRELVSAHHGSLELHYRRRERNDGSGNLASHDRASTVRVIRIRCNTRCS
jgi:signal transduction histidine kinase